MPNILVVDDEPALRRALRRLMEKKGWTVVEAGDGWASVATPGPLPDVAAKLGRLLPPARK